MDLTATSHIEREEKAAHLAGTSFIQRLFAFSSTHALVWCSTKGHFSETAPFTPILHSQPSFLFQLRDTARTGLFTWLRFERWRWSLLHLCIFYFPSRLGEQLSTQTSPNMQIWCSLYFFVKGTQASLVKNAGWARLCKLFLDIKDVIYSFPIFLNHTHFPLRKM